MSDQVYKIRLKKGDEVMVRAGKDKGKTGKVLSTHPRLNKVTVEGVNIARKHQKPNREHPQGDIIELTRPIWVSKVSIVDPSTKKPSRIGYATTKEGNKRIYKSSGKDIK